MKLKNFFKFKFFNPVFIFFRVGREFKYPTTKVGIFLVSKLISFFDFFKKTKHSDLMYAFYDLSISPNTYNFCEFIVLCNNEIIKRKLNGYKIIFIKRKKNPKIISNEKYFGVIDDELYEWRFFNILSPLTLCTDKCIGFDIVSNDEELKKYLVYNNKYPKFFNMTNRLRVDTNILYREFNNLTNIELISPKAANTYLNILLSAIKIEEFLTISIRYQEYDKVRNSDLDSWNKFTNFLKENTNYSVVIIPDTDNFKATSKLFDGCYQAFEASHNLLLRFAYYKRAKFNFFAGGGPSSLCYLTTDIKYIMFNYGPVKNSIVHTPEAFKNFETNKEKNFKFSSIGQILIWDSDTYTNLMKYYKIYVKKYI